MKGYTMRWLRFPRKVKTSHVAIAALSMIIVGLIAFGYFYLLRLPPKFISYVNTYAEAVTNSPPRFLANITGFTPETEMSGPLSVAVDERGRVYVTDSNKGRVQVYDPNGRLILQFGRPGSGEGEMNYPNTIAVRKDRVYVGEVNARRIQVFDREGRFAASIDERSTGWPVLPLAMDFGEDELLYVANRTGEVLVFDLEGKLLRKFANAGSGEGQLSYPNGIAVRENKVYVADSGNRRLQIFDLEGNLIRVLPVGLSLPRGIDLDSLGRLYLVDTFGNRVVVYDQDFKYLFSFGERGFDEGKLNFPNQMAIGPGDRIYVADRENNRVAVFGY